MWTYRRMLKIPWTSHTTNEEVLRRLGIERELFKLVKVRKSAYLGHILGNSKYRYAQLIVKGKIDGKQGLDEFATVISNLH